MSSLPSLCRIAPAAHRETSTQKLLNLIRVPSLSKIIACTSKYYHSVKSYTDIIQLFSAFCNIFPQNQCCIKICSEYNGILPCEKHSKAAAQNCFPHRRFASLQLFLIISHYKIIQISPPLPSLIIFWRVSCKRSCASSGIR